VVRVADHYHALVETSDIKALLRELGLLHGRTAHKEWRGKRAGEKFSSVLSSGRCGQTGITGRH
jgi:hypothetical protein